MSADRTPGDFGRKLREARERRGVSLRHIASATKISVGVLEALERNDISRLPGGIFSRAFVRSYAIEVGLDPEATIQEFIAQFPHDSVTAGHPTSDQVEDHDALESDRRMATTFLRLIAISVPIAIAVMYFSGVGRRLIQKSETPAAAVAMPAPAEPKSATPAAVLEDPASPPQSDKLMVAIDVKRPCWVSATVDGKKTIERLLQPGDAQTFDIRRELVLSAGDAAALALTINGAAGKPLGKDGEVVTRRINLTNYKDFLESR
jgi:cytoskeleton protein RodZ